MKIKSKFKYVFWGLIAATILLLIPAVSMFLVKVNSIEFKFAMLLPLIIFLPAYIIIIARFVYNDASRRGIDPWQWATIAVFIPNFIGLIIYLIVRSKIKFTCVNCGKEIHEDFKICPYCTHPVTWIKNKDISKRDGTLNL